MNAFMHKISNSPDNARILGTAFGLLSIALPLNTHESRTKISDSQTRGIDVIKGFVSSR
ncbi:hypothetical protein Mapa_004295 [Marchantia paleacea]|nr:hypothetical protein Mapa_004295 [Marchantia paleacea]